MTKPNRWLPVAGLLGLIVAGQAVLYGPALAGKTVLLPLGNLGSIYFYGHTSRPEMRTQNGTLSDQVTAFDPYRVFTGAEFRQGRYPSWNPHLYAGAPNAGPAKLSPFEWLFYLAPSPYWYAWLSLIKSVVGGLGMYCFLRRASELPPSASVWGGALYPLVGGMPLWDGFSVVYAIALFPWLLVATHASVTATGRAGSLGLPIATFLLVVSGMSIDVAAQGLVISGLYAVWLLMQQFLQTRSVRGVVFSGLTVGLGWGVGLALAAPHVLPILDYAQKSERFANRSSGFEARPPRGLYTAGEMLLPTLYGTGTATNPRAVPLANVDRWSVLVEGNALAYAGLLVLVALAPLGLLTASRFRDTTFWCLLVLGGIAWNLAIPGWVHLLRWGPLVTFSHNRWAMFSSLALVVLGARGAACVWERAGAGQVFAAEWRAWRVRVAAGAVCVVVGVVIGLCLLDGAFAGFLPKFLGDQSALRAAGPHLKRFEMVYRQTCYWGIGLCAVAALFWLVWAYRPRWRVVLLAVPVVALVEPLLFYRGFHPQSPAEWYFPPLAVFENIRREPWSRMVAANCLWPNVPMRIGLNDVRGYDGVDPVGTVSLLKLAGTNDGAPEYAATAAFVPSTRVDEEGTLRFHPVLDQLCVRFVIYRGTVPEGARVWEKGEGYTVVENPHARPRTWVVEDVETVSVDRALAARARPASRPPAEVLARVAEWSFDPSRKAFVEEAVPLGQTRGTASPAEATSADTASADTAPADATPVGISKLVLDETTHLEVEATLARPGLVILADAWDSDWHATLDGVSVPVLRVNGILRGVVTPAGPHRLVFDYRPRSLTRGIQLALAALALYTLWAVAIAWRTPASGGREPPD